MLVKRAWLLPIIMPLMVSMVSCGVVVRGIHKGVVAVRDSTLFHQGRHGPLTEQEQEWAKVAWRYFENNYNPQTGLVNGIDRHPSTTMWYTADYLAALVAAHQLALIETREFDSRFSKLLHSLNSMELFAGKLPNKVYHTSTGAMVDFANQPGAVGWSALDLGRLLIWLRITRERYPEYHEYIDKAILRWNFCDVVNRCGELMAAVNGADGIELYQEGRLGYEQYAAMGYQAWGFDTTRASSLEPFQLAKIYGIEVVHDGRDPRETGTQAPVLSMPYVLHGLEFNWHPLDRRHGPDGSHGDSTMAELASRVYTVQETRFQRERIFTARTERQLGRPPFFVYDSVFAAGYPWNTISERGEAHPDLALISTRATFGMWALWKTAYTTQLMKMVEFLFDAERGWYEGRYEQTGGYEDTITCTTNALVLESLLYKVQGKLYRGSPDSGYMQHKLRDVFKRPGRCFPPERDACG